MSQEKHILSKSTFIRGDQCLKSLYLHKNRPFLRDKLAPEQLAKFRRGHEVGKLAWELFPGGISCAPGHPTQFRKSLEQTRALIEEGTPVIYEAGFQHDGVLIFLDILVKTNEGYHAYEVKSSLRISDTYLTDAALQYYVMKGAGIDPLQISIIHMNEHYCMGESPDVSALFSIRNVTELVIEKQDYIQHKIQEGKEAVHLKKSPPIEVGRQCYNPYPCDFLGHCWKKIPESSVFYIKGIPANRRFEWMEAGFQNALEIPSDTLTDAEKQIIDIHLSGKPWRNKEYLHQIASFQAPLLITFLTIRPAVPLFEHCHPFQHLIVGYASANMQGETDVFISEPGINPIPIITEKLTALFQLYQNILFAEPEAGMNLKEILKGYSANKEFVDVSTVFQPTNYYQPGIDPEASFAENLSILLPETIQKKPTSHIMAGVKYLTDASKDKDFVVEELSDYLKENLRHLQLLYGFLVDADRE